MHPDAYAHSILILAEMPVSIQNVAILGAVYFKGTTYS